MINLTATSNTGVGHAILAPAHAFLPINPRNRRMRPRRPADDWPRVAASKAAKSRISQTSFVKMSLMDRRRDLWLLCCAVVCFVMLTQVAAASLDDYGAEYEPPLEIQQQEEPPREVRKRSTVLLNRLVYALHSALQPDSYPPSPQQTELQRRGYPKHYWKCYFNAVSCFRRKR